MRRTPRAFFRWAEPDSETVNGLCGLRGWPGGVMTTIDCAMAEKQLQRIEIIGGN